LFQTFAMMFLSPHDYPPLTTEGRLTRLLPLATGEVSIIVSRTTPNSLSVALERQKSAQIASTAVRVRVQK
jgi:hypothetical protein